MQVWRNFFDFYQKLAAGPSVVATSSKCGRNIPFPSQNLPTLRAEIEVNRIVNNSV
jgi:hypothetical protein